MNRMKKGIMLLLSALLVVSLGACGQKGESKGAWTVAQGENILNSGAFSDELEELDLDTAFMLYQLGDAGLSREDLTDGICRRSAGATCEELTILIFKDQASAETANQAIKGYLEGQIAANTDYRPAEIPKLKDAWVEQRDNALLMLVADDVQIAKDAAENQ